MMRSLSSGVSCARTSSILRTLATALAVVMLVISFVLLLAINLLQWWAANRHKGEVHEVARP